MAKKKASKRTTPVKRSPESLPKRSTKRATKKAAPRVKRKAASKRTKASSPKRPSRSRSTQPAETLSPPSSPISNEPSETTAEPRKLPWTPPASLAKKPIALKKWRELANELELKGLLESIDLGLFAIYCDAWQEYSDAQEASDKHGIFFTTEKGYIAIHPAELIKEKAVKKIISCGDRLGLGAKARKGLGLKPKNGEDETGNQDPLVAYSKKKS